MVRIRVKQSEEQQFLFDCPTTSTIQDVSRDIIEIYSLQSQTQHLVQILESHLLLNSKDDCSKYVLALKRALSEAKTYASKDQVQHQKPLSPHVLKDLLQNIKNEVKVSNITALTEAIVPQQLFSSDATGFGLLHENTTELWWAGKKLTRDKRLCVYVGKNEKTKITVRLQSPDLAPP